MQATFQMWNALHYVMMIFPFFFALILFTFMKNKTEFNQRLVAFILSIIMIIILIARSVYMIDKKGGLNPEVIPLQICHFANILLLYVSISRSKTAAAIAWCLNFPAALVSVIFANSLENYNNILTVQGIAYISGHMLIVAVTLYMLLIKIIKIDFKALINSYGIISLAFVLSVLINNWFNQLFAHTNTASNYFYTFKPEDGTPLETFFNMGSSVDIGFITLNPIYLLMTALLGFIVMFVMYMVYHLYSRLIK